MNTPPVISIIIPTYNSSKTLATALDSIARQTFKKLEVLIVDGVSKDNTIEIASSYIDKLNSLLISSEPDRGVYDAMNKGIQKAKGEWLYFLGSDDYLYDDNVLEKISGHFNGDWDVIYGNVYRRTKLNPVYGQEFDLYKITKKNMGHQAMFYRKNVFGRTGLYNLNYKVMADHFLNTQLFLGDYKLKYENMVVAEYFEGGLSNNYHHDHEQIEIKKYILQQGKSVPNKLKLELAYEIFNFDKNIHYLSFFERLYLKMRHCYYLVMVKFFA